MTYTPGPWAIEDRIGDFELLIVGRKPRRATIATIENMKLEDARLIAAAPDLLAALEELAHPTMDAYELGHLSDMQQMDIETARAAIANAKRGE